MRSEIETILSIMVRSWGWYKVHLINPLLLNVPKRERLAKILILIYEGIIKKFLGALRLWVGRQKEPILGYVPKNCEKNNSGSNGLIFILWINCNRIYLFCVICPLPWKKLPIEKQFFTSCQFSNCILSRILATFL